MVVEKKYHFYTAHRNKKAGIKCGRIHGHTYDVTCKFKFDELVDGVTMLFSDIDAIAEAIVKEYDHYLILFDEDPLCDVLEFAGEEFICLPFETSAENLSIWLFNKLKQHLPIVEIELAETKTSKVVYNEYSN